MRSAGIAAFVALVTASAVSATDAKTPDVTELAAKIDKHIEARWKAEKVTPAALADDAVFARRAYLDLAGHIPTVSEAREFLDDTTAGKRSKLVAKLVGSSAHARHMAVFWRREWIPQADTPQFTYLTEQADEWIAAQLTKNTPYDRIVHDLLTGGQRGLGRVTPGMFLAASENKPENLAANTTRSFLGLNLDCAQCHNHPFARWSQEQFWQTAAFFVRADVAKSDAPPLELIIPNTKKTARARFLDGREPALPATSTGDTGRLMLAEWATAKRNPYFAKNAVNRL